MLPVLINCYHNAVYRYSPNHSAASQYNAGPLMNDIVASIPRFSYSAEMLKKIALISAVSRNAIKPVIDLRDVAFASSVVSQMSTLPL